VLRVELAIGGRKQSLYDLTVLALAGRSGQPAKPARGIEVRDPGALEEDLLDIGTGDQLGQRTEIGDRPQDAADHLARVAEWNLVAEVGAALVLVHSAMNLSPHFVEITLGPEPTTLDPNEGVTPDAVVRVGTRGHRSMTGTRARRLAAARDRLAVKARGAIFAANTATALAYGPLGTRVPDQAAASTRWS
jgi:hypothetical protein